MTDLREERKLGPAFRRCEAKYGVQMAVVLDDQKHHQTFNYLRIREACAKAGCCCHPPAKMKELWEMASCVDSPHDEGGWRVKVVAVEGKHAPYVVTEGEHAVALYMLLDRPIFGRVIEKETAPI